MEDKNYYTDVAIIGAGISGTALLYMLARYTDVESISIFEKYKKSSTLNSNAKANSQTLHLGDIETNYDLEKAKKVNKSSSMVANFIEYAGLVDDVGFKKTKMVLAVGEDEIERLKQRYKEFKSTYPYLELWNEEDLKDIEPSLVEKREEPILAMGVKNTISTVNYGKLSQKFIELSLKEEVSTTIHYKTDVEKITRKWGNYLLHTNRGEFMAKTIVVNAGAHSLLLAHNMGYGKDYALLPIGGSFYFTKKKILNSKVYTMQNPKLPFAAVHGDPDLTAKWKTRFGPTAFAMAKLERYHDVELGNLFGLLNIDKSVLSVYKDLMVDDEIRAYIFRNMAHELPHIGQEFFIKEAQKIIPSLNAKDLEYADGYGGMRPQIIDKTNKTLLLGEAKIDTGKGIIFNMTPSPGASSCLGNAFKDAKILAKFLDIEIRKSQIKKELCNEKQNCNIYE